MGLLKQVLRPPDANTASKRMQRVTQLGVLDCAELAPQLVLDDRIGRLLLLLHPGFTRLQRALEEAKTCHRPITEVSVDTFHDQRFQMLKLGSQATVDDPKEQRPLAPLPGAVGHTHRSALRGQNGAHDLRPVPHKGPVRHTAFREGGSGQPIDNFSDRPRISASEVSCHRLVDFDWGPFHLHHMVCRTVKTSNGALTLDVMPESLENALHGRVSRRLLSWYRGNRRDLPWRAPPGKVSDPYRVWLSEIMLQQTTVATVIPYYLSFLERWPTVEALAEAELDEVLHAWQGLGYYARARNLHACAKQVAGDHAGRFPTTESELLELPGVGPYTAAAIAAIAFGRRAAPVDGNVERVIARLFAIAEALPAAKKNIRRIAADLTPSDRPGDFWQAVMDLGATVCTPRQPDCASCPLSGNCAAWSMGSPGLFPRKAPRRSRPVRYGVAFWLRNGRGEVLLRRRPPRGLLGGMMEVPSTEWRDAPWTWKEAGFEAPVRTEWRPLRAVIHHTFTHFHLELGILAGEIDGHRELNGAWCQIGRFGDQALPTVMWKIVNEAVLELTGRRLAVTGRRSLGR